MSTYDPLCGMDGESLAVLPRANTSPKRSEDDADRATQGNSRRRKGSASRPVRSDDAIRVAAKLAIDTAHVLALDGVYVRDGPQGMLAFHALPAPKRAEVTGMARPDRRSGRAHLAGRRTQPRAERAGL